MATVRIYRVAEILGTSSQEVVALLKRDHGIDVKSASSTIEEVVARQFVERLAKQRNVALPPPAQMFAEGTPVPASKPTLKKAGGKAPEPPKPAAPVMPAPRLVKIVKHPVAPAAAAPAAEVPTHGDAAPSLPVDVIPVLADEPATTPAPVAEVIAAPVAEQPEPVAASSPEPAVDVEPVADAVARTPEPSADETASAAPVAAAEPEVTESESASSAAEAADAAADANGDASGPGGRLIPSSLKLRIEDPTKPITEGPRPTLRPSSAKPATPSQPTTRTQAPIPPQPRQPLGGPRPLPAQPVRPAAGPQAAPPGGIRTPLQPYVRPSYQPSGYVAPGANRPSGPGGPGQRPGMPGQRPGAPGSNQPQGGRPQPGRPTTSGPRKKGFQIRRELTNMPMQQTPSGPPPVTRAITLAEGMTVKDLADKLEVKVKDVLKSLMEKRMVMTINTTLDTDTAMMIARQFGADVKMRTFEDEIGDVQNTASNPEDLEPRAPVVTVMGHVDHGKTTLLDAIRSTRVAEREAGGITQHIGAYAVEVNKRKVVFLDTPGHEAFTMMRARGARVTDAVILVVAADDGVMPQTKEAIDHARAAGVPIIVAINKIDKANANPERVMNELSELGLMPEAWGGQTVTVPISAKKRENLELLLEMILLVTEIADLKANPKRQASGTVLEAKLDKGRGSVATVLVQDGTLAVGDTFIAGTIVSKVRALIDDRGRNVRQAPPSTPVEVLGLDGLPSPGDTFQVINDPAKARQIAMYRQTQAKEKTVVRAPRTLEDIQQALKEGELKELAIIIKADVGGSAEVLASTLQKLTDDTVKIRIIHSGVGAINESDVLLASASNAIVIGFNVRPDRNAADVAEREKVDLRLHSVIYNVTDEIKKAMTGLLEPVKKEVRLGVAEVRQIFKVPKAGTVAGCMVIDGIIKRSGGAQARLLRDNVVVYEGSLGSLKRFKDDVGEVKSGFECGLSFERYNDLKVGDHVEVFVVEQVAATAS